MAEQKQFLLTTAELASFQHVLLHTPSVTLHGSLSQGTLEMVTALGTVRLSYEFCASDDGAVGTLTLYIADKPQWWPAEQIFQQIASGIEAARRPAAEAANEAHA